MKEQFRFNFRKKLTDLIDAKITAENEFQKGSIFTIMLRSITHTSNKNNNKERFEWKGTKFSEITEDKIFTAAGSTVDDIL